MTKLDFGPPGGAIVQFAYTVPDLAAAMDRYTRVRHLGPWFLVEHFAPADMMYRGAPSDVDYNLAIAFTGNVQIELIEQSGPTPSVYREVIDRAGYGFHHWGVASLDFDADVRELEAQGYEVAFSARAPAGGRFAYLDTTADLPGMVELIEMNPPTERMFTDWYRASVGWDGTDPVRRIT